ncbi:MAG: type II secretion system minor pseudopilin GspJ [Pseudomonadales bacterium]
MQVLGRDIMQYRARGVRDELGDRQAPLLLDDDGLLEFTHAGWRNPLGQRRADLQRVAYVYDRDSRELRRLYWLVLDRVADSEPVQQTLLTNVDSVRFLIMDQAGNQYDYWPTIASEGADAQPPVAIVVRLEAAPFGLLERVWEMPVG